MTRDEAEKAYVDAILSRGNPAYFVWLAVERMDNLELMDSLSEMQIDVEEIVEEE